MAKDMFQVINKGSTALEASHLISANPTILIGLTGHNSGPDQYIQLHNAAAVPADGEVPKIVFKVLAASSFSLDYSPDGRVFSIGLVVCNSTTVGTLTIGSTDCWFDVQVTPTVYK